MFWELPPELLVDPQQQNSYSYGRNNPINRSDPSGELNVIIPGTNYKIENWNDKHVLYKNVSETFGGNTWVYNDQSRWSGGDNRWARSVAVGNLLSDIKNYNFQANEQLNIIAHSHGGNVAFGLSQLLEKNIDTLVTLGTPIRDDYKPNYGKINKHINVFSKDDKVQNHGGNSQSVSAIFGKLFAGYAGNKIGEYLRFGEFGVAGRTLDGATNVEVSNNTPINPFTSHSQLATNQDIWNRVKEHINK
jgi:hypothetical protein